MIEALALIPWLALPLAGIADRVRGGYPEGRPKWVKYSAMACIGPCLMLQVTTDPVILLASMVAAFITMWRQDNGWRGRWVALDLKTQDFSWTHILKPLQWGAIASLSLLPFMLWVSGLWLAVITSLAFMLGAILAQVIAIQLPAMNVFDLRNAWPWSELIELPIIGLLLNVGHRFC